MVLDTVSLRVSFAIVAFTLLALFYFVTYRSTRSTYCGWWCLALVTFLLGSAAYLFDGTSQQWWGNPTGNMLIVLGAACVWAGGRSLNRRDAPIARIGAAAAVVLAASAVDDPATNLWSGGPVYLAMMTLLISLGGANLWAAARGADPVHQQTVRSMSIITWLLATFYGVRLIAFLAVGQHGEFFATYLNSNVATILNTVLLTTVAYSMTALSHAEATDDLRTQATHDGLTGLLNRAEFERQTAIRWQAGGRTEIGSLVLADLDHFKTVNDSFGHSAGDYALQTFAAACRGVVRSTDLIGRYGGEEFALFLDDTPVDRAEQIAVEISDRLRRTTTPDGMKLPTVSYGIAAATPTLAVDEVIAVADRALYEAKNQGRDRIVVGS